MKRLAATAVLALAVSASALGASPQDVEHVSQGAQNGNGPNHVSFAGVSADGTHVFFITDEVLAGTDGDTSLDLYQRAGGQTTQVSLGAINGDLPFAPQYVGSSADGSRVFLRTAEPLVATDTDARFDIYQRFNGLTTAVSEGNGTEDVDFLAASADGSHVLFRTREGLLASDDDVNRFDIYGRVNGALVHVNGARRPGVPPDDAIFRGISEDGTHLFYDTFEEVLASDDETGGAALDVYERFGNSTFHITDGSNALISSTFVGASADSSRVFFATSESRDGVTDTDATQDIYERSAVGFTHVSQGVVLGNGPRSAVFLDASTDGSRVLFSSSARLAAGDTDTAQDIYERSGGETRLVSAGSAAVPVFFQAASADGSRVFFTTTEPLAASDTDGAIDVYQASGGQMIRASGGNGAQHSTFRGISADGTRAFFDTTESLVAGDTDTAVDLYESRDGQITQVSSGNGPHSVGFDGLSLDGARVFFHTLEALAATDTDSVTDVYGAGPATPTPTPTATPTPVGTAAAPAPPAATAVTSPPTPAPVSAPPAARQAPTLIGSSTLRIKRNIASIALRCGPAPCQGSARLDSIRPRRLKLGTASYRIAAGQRARLRIRLPSAARRLVARRTLQATLTLRESGGPVRRIQLTLRRR